MFTHLGKVTTRPIKHAELDDRTRVRVTSSKKRTPREASRVLRELLDLAAQFEHKIDLHRST